jgi:hypothetical protein
VRVSVCCGFGDAVAVLRWGSHVGRGPAAGSATGNRNQMAFLLAATHFHEVHVLLCWESGIQPSNISVVTFCFG